MTVGTPRAGGYEESLTTTNDISVLRVQLPVQFETHMGIVFAVSRRHIYAHGSG
jgi:hypothetical protein